MTKFVTDFVCTAQMKIKAGMMENFLNSIVKMVVLTRQEAGCLRYEVHQDLDNAEQIIFIERFKDKVAFEAHCTSHYIQHFFNDVVPKMVDEVKFSTYSEFYF